MIIYNHLVDVNYSDYLDIFSEGSIMKWRCRGAQGHMNEHAAKDQDMKVQVKVATED